MFGAARIQFEIKSFNGTRNWFINRIVLLTAAESLCVSAARGKVRDYFKTLTNFPRHVRA